MKYFFLHKEKGFVGLYLAILMLLLMMGILASIAFGVLTQQRIIRNTTQSAQAYFAAESGVEDALIRLANGQNVCDPPGNPPCSNSFVIDDSIVNIAVSDILAGARTITVEGDLKNRFRKVQIVYEISATTPGFFYGAQVGDLGIIMENSSRIIGNVFSDGTITGAGSSRIEGTVKVAGPGNEISDSEITGDAYVDVCEDSSIAGTLHAVTNSGCTDYVSLTSSGAPPNPIPMPIPIAQVDAWKLEAEAAGTIGSQTFSSGIVSLGPIKINGDLTVSNTAELKIMGTLWVTGKVTISNSAKVHLDSSYGSLSGMVISNGQIILENSSISSGSGDSGSYLMYLSTSATDPAITIKNSAQVDILYSTDQRIQVENSAAMREITGYGLRIKNSATVTYEIGLQDAAFTSGPGGGWAVTSWKEIP